MPDQTLTPVQRVSIISTVALFVAFSALAALSAKNGWTLWLAISVGGLGGLVHEFAQSGGKIVFFQTHSDGLYLGSVAGLVLGAVAGVLVVRGHLIGEIPDEGTTRLSYELFMAGLALKGVVEAAGGNVVPEK